MSTDLIELALERFTDWSRFERLAAEVMRDEGYPDIKVLGGVHDEGQDATVERFYSGTAGRLRVVFQFSLRDDVAQKVNQTVDRLRKAKIEFEKLVIVTPAAVSSEKQRAIRLSARNDRGVELEVYERQTLLNRLADPTTGLFARYFPDIQTQVDAMRRAEAGPGTVEARESEQLKVCYAFLLAPEAAHTRKSLVDTAILSLVDSAPKTPVELRQVAEQRLTAAVLDEQQIRASVERLERAGLVSASDGRFALTSDGATRIQGAGAAQTARGHAVVRDLVDDVEEALGTPLADNQRLQLESNARDVLVEFFRTNGVELANTFLAGDGRLVYAEVVPRSRELAKRRLPAHFGELLLAAIARALTSPTAEQSTYFARCSRAYVALQVLSCDPALREFQVTRFSTKMFILDTDVVLTAMIKELPLSATYRNLIRDLRSLGARIIVPEQVVGEVVTHLDIAPRTYDYFGGGFNGLNLPLAVSRIWNALVRGYWHATVERGLTATREGFLKFRENYFEGDGSRAFVVQAIEDALPNIEFVTVDSIAKGGYSAEDHQSLTTVFDHAAEASPKSPDRTLEQRQAIADVDARLFLAVERYNHEARAAAGVLGAAAYVITSSGRFARAAGQLKRAWPYAARPQILTALIEMITPRLVEDREFVNLFENPFLQGVVDACWAGVHVLLTAGLSLRDKSLTRLRFDVEKRLQEQIVRLESADAAADVAEDEALLTAAEQSADAEHLRLLEEARRFGYRPTRLLEEVLNTQRVDQAELSRLARENAELRARVERFGRKHARWLKRLKKMT